MIKGNSHQLGEVAPMAVDTRASDTGLSHDTFTAMVGQIMGEFEAGSADIQDAIAARVMSRLTHHVQQEVMRVLQDALSDAAQSWGTAGWIQRGDSVEDETVGEEMVEGPTQPEPERVAQPEPFVRDEPEPVAAAEPVSIVESRVEEIASSVDEPGHDEDGPQSEGIGEVYEGTVKLRVDATDSFRQVIQFVEALRQKAGFRLLKLVGGFEDGVDILGGPQGAHRHQRGADDDAGGSTGHTGPLAGAGCLRATHQTSAWPTTQYPKTPSKTWMDRALSRNAGTRCPDRTNGSHSYGTCG